MQKTLIFFSPKHVKMNDFAYKNYMVLSSLYSSMSSMIKFLILI